MTNKKTTQMKIFSIKEASSFLQISETTLYRNIKTGKVPAQKIGKQWRLSEQALVDWLNDKNISENNIVPLFNSAPSKKAGVGNPLKYIDLFCGIGGFRQAASKFNMECVFSSDNDKCAQATYEHWYGEKPVGDIMEYTSTEEKLDLIPSFDVLFAGFPCQPFSYAGRNEGFEDKTRGTLFFHVAKILQHHKPKALILENVKGLKSHNKGETIETIKQTLSDIGYVLFDDVINSINFGVPQYRERWFCVGIRKDLIDRSVHFQLNKGDTSASPILKDILDDLDLESHPNLKIPLFEQERIKYHFDNMEHYETGRVKHDNSKYSPQTKKGKHGVYSFLKPDKTLRFHIGDIAKTQIQEAYYVHSNTYAPAIIANRRPKLWDINRFMSVKECMRLQSFPCSLEFPVSNAQAFKQLGNSVCVNVVESVIKDMHEILEHSQPISKSA